MDKFLRVATLSDDEIAKIRALEAITGAHIMAFEPGLKIASLSGDDLLKVKELEAQLNATLLAFEAD